MLILLTVVSSSSALDRLRLREGQLESRRLLAEERHGRLSMVSALKKRPGVLSQQWEKTQSTRTEEEMRETRRRLARKRDPRRGERYGRGSIARLSIHRVLEHLESLIDDIEIVPLQYETSTYIIV